MTLPQGLHSDKDGLKRCFWPGDHEDYRAYHDTEWGVPTSSDIQLFEKICLEGFQSGLSWLTILRKRENFRNAFAGFNYRKLAMFGKYEVERLMDDRTIVRHLGKIRSTINNAKRALELEAEFGSLSAFFWRYEPVPATRPEHITYEWLMANPVSVESTALAAALKKRGWSFVGPTTAYAFMQSVGLVNDHMEGCHYRMLVEASRKAFPRP